jgi:hypothetical protein
MFLALEICLTAVCVAIAVIHPTLGNRFFAKLEGKFSNLGNERMLPVTVGLISLALRAAILPILPIPQPAVSDEYSYLLLADTLAHGRLANPTHPMWVHFETFHVNWHPTYASMYYPGYALFLAFGQVVMGHPFWGVWLSSGLMCAAICWALQGWLPAGWALIGSLVAVIRLSTFSYWVDSYWGGTVTAIGGALVLGALPRLKKGKTTRNSALMALGMAILATTRPYEGLFFCLPIIISLAYWTIRRSELRSGQVLSRIVLPTTVVIAASLAALGYYFWRVTGNPFTIPYQLNMRTYGLVFFPWERIRPVLFHHAALEGSYRGGAVLGFYDLARSHPFKLQFLKALVIWLFYFGPLLSLPWLAWIFTRPRGGFWKSLTMELRFLFIILIAEYLSLAVTIHLGQPHYAAALTIVFYLVTLFMMRDLYNSGSAHPGRRFISRSAPVVCVLLFLTRSAAPLLHITPKPSWTRTWCSQDDQNLQRARILTKLEQTAGDHVVIVRYKPGHNFILDEWVFNNADIDHSKVIWARDMGPQNAELVDYFKGRHVWLVEPDYSPPRLSVYVH